MKLMETLVAKPPPVQMDKDGVLRVGGTRVTLDLVVDDYRLGASAEQIALNYDSLTLADIHGAIRYYLENREIVEEYLEQRRRQAEEIRKEVECRSPQAEIRERLLAKQAQQNR